MGTRTGCHAHARVGMIDWERARPRPQSTQNNPRKTTATAREPGEML
jgi:hypothetical protein